MPHLKIMTLFDLTNPEMNQTVLKSWGITAAHWAYIFSSFRRKKFCQTEYKTCYD